MTGTNEPALSSTCKSSGKLNKHDLSVDITLVSGLGREMFFKL